MFHLVPLGLRHSSDEATGLTPYFLPFDMTKMVRLTTMSIPQIAHHLISRPLLARQVVDQLPHCLILKDEKDTFREPSIEKWSR